MEKKERERRRNPYNAPTTVVHEYGEDPTDHEGVHGRYTGKTGVQGGFVHMAHDVTVLLLECVYQRWYRLPTAKLVHATPVPARWSCWDPGGSETGSSGEGRTSGSEPKGWCQRGLGSQEDFSLICSNPLWCEPPSNWLSLLSSGSPVSCRAPQEQPPSGVSLTHH